MPRGIVEKWIYKENGFIRKNGMRWMVLEGRLLPLLQVEKKGRRRGREEP